MWCLLTLLCFQGIAFLAGFPSTLNFEEIQKRKPRNPECFMNVSEIIRYHGYPSEEYEVTTEDGYILRVFRIPGGRNGRNTGFIAFSTYRELAQRVKVFFALGPVATCTYSTSPLIKSASVPESLLRLVFGWKGTMHQIEFLRGPVTQFCTSLDKLCGRILAYIAGGSTQNLNTSRTDAYVAHSPAGTSVQNIIHWHQLIYAEQFQAYDYGAKENMKKYNQSTPPVYEIEKMNIAVAAWSAGCDKFADPKDMAKLLPRITKLIYHEHFPDWGHLDFIWGLDATKKMYLKILELITKYL